MSKTSEYIRAKLRQALSEDDPEFGRCDFLYLPELAGLLDELEGCCFIADLAEAYGRRLERRLLVTTEALKYIADPLQHHYKPDYLAPEKVARIALEKLDQPLSLEGS